MLGRQGWNPYDPAQCGHNVYATSRIAHLPDQYLGIEGGDSAANARLIAAAPDLLAACRAALQLIEEPYPDADDYFDAEVAASLIAAIEQATDC